MGAPAEVEEKALRELHIQLSPSAKKAMAERKEAAAGQKEEAA